MKYTPEQFADELQATTKEERAFAKMLWIATKYGQPFEFAVNSAVNMYKAGIVGSEAKTSRRAPIDESDILRVIGADSTWKSFNRITGMLYYSHDGVTKENIKFAVESFWTKYRLDDLTEADDAKTFDGFMARAYKGKVEVCAIKYPLSK